MPDPLLTTPHLSLMAAEPRLVLALIDSVEAFEAAADLRAAPGLRDMYVSADVSPAWVAALRQDPRFDPWRHGFFVVNPATRVAIGGAGFKGPVDPDRVVELAYGLAPGYRGRGLATEVARGLTTYAASAAPVRRFRAHTLSANPPSHRVLEKCGFAYLGDVIDPEDGRVMRWERDVQDDVSSVVFVYGTLRRDAGHSMHDVLASVSTSLGGATTGGHLFHLGTYPGMRPSLDGSLVVGEAYAIRTGRERELLRTLDDYEGVVVGGRPSGEFVRRIVEIRLTDGQRSTAWAWILSEVDPPYPRIRSGDVMRADDAE